MFGFGLGADSDSADIKSSLVCTTRLHLSEFFSALVWTERPVRVGIMQQAVFFPHTGLQVRTWELMFAKKNFNPKPQTHTQTHTKQNRFLKIVSSKTSQDFTASFYSRDGVFK